jgi:hypothetical protein
MKESLFVIATRGRQGKEVYLKCSDKETKGGKILMEWTENIDEAMATFSYTEVEECAQKYFKNFNKWYIKGYQATFN